MTQAITVLRTRSGGIRVLLLISLHHGFGHNYRNTQQFVASSVAPGSECDVTRQGVDLPLFELLAPDPRKLPGADANHGHG